MTASPTCFYGSKLKVERAKLHLNDLSKQLGDYAKRKPHYLLVEASKAGPDRYDLVARTREPLPEQFNLIVGDALHNLRSSLDLLACDLARAGGLDTKGVYFPVGRDAAHFEQRLKATGIAKLGKNLVNGFRELRPYLGGNEALRHVHEMNITDKHVELLQLAPHGVMPTLRLRNEEDGSYLFQLEACRFSPLQDGFRIIRGMPAPTNVKAGDELPLLFELQFGPGMPYESAPVIPVVEYLIREVEKAMSHLEQFVTA